MSIYVFALSVVLFAYFLFRDTLNKVQYIEFLRLYWITRDTGEKGTPFFSRSFMRQTSAPFWRGNGYQVRIGKYTFQIGRLDLKVDSLEAQISNIGWLPTDPKTLRKW